MKSVISPKAVRISADANAIYFFMDVLGTGYWALGSGYWALGAGFWYSNFCLPALFTVHSLPFTVYCSLFTVHTTHHPSTPTGNQWNKHIGYEVNGKVRNDIGFQVALLDVEECQQQTCRCRDNDSSQSLAIVDQAGRYR